MTTRAEHLQWCKDRAIEIVNSGNVPGGWTSFRSDMSKEVETADHTALPLGDMMLISGQLETATAMIKFIQDFN